MSRYQKAISGEIELEEISGIKFVLYPTIETRMEMLDLVKASQLVEEIDVKDASGRIVSTKRIKGQNFSFKSIAAVCARIIFEGCYNHNEKGVIISKKEEEKETTERDILGILLQSDILTIYITILQKLDIISNDKADEIKLQASAQIKKKVD